MVFTFKDGSTKTYTFGYKVHGLKKEGRRPISVTLTKNEMANVPGWTKQMTEDYLYGIVNPILNMDGEVIINE